MENIMQWMIQLNIMKKTIVVVKKQKKQNMEKNIFIVVTIQMNSFINIFVKII